MTFIKLPVAVIDAVGPKYRLVVVRQRSVDKCARYRPPNVVEIGKLYIWGALTPNVMTLRKPPGTVIDALGPMYRTVADRCSSVDNRAR